MMNIPTLSSFLHTLAFTFLTSLRLTLFQWHLHLGTHLPGGKNPSLRLVLQNPVTRHVGLLYVVLNVFLLSQDVVYEDKAQLETVLNKLRRLPPLVSPVEVSVCGENSLTLLSNMLTCVCLCRRVDF